MKLRLSDGYSRAVEFSAGNAREFRLHLRRVMLEFFAQAGQHAELHVATDTGDWITPNYPRSNAPALIVRGAAVNATTLWQQVQRANQAGTWTDFELRNMADFLACRKH